jgi:menaquinone-specific isochorismate synthase
VSHLLSNQPAVSAAEAVAAMRDRIVEEIARFQSEPPEDDSPSIIRISVAIERVDLLDWLSVQKATPQVFWSQREGTWEVGGLGAADQFTVASPVDYSPVFQRLAIACRYGPEALRYFGGVSFDPDSRIDTGSVWNSFPACWFVLPRFEIVRYGEDFLFVTNIRDDETGPKAIDRILESLEELAFTGQIERIEGTATETIEHLPNMTGWTAEVTDTLARIADGVLEKAVLGRQTTVTLNQPENPWQVLKRLPDGSGSFYRFGLRLRSGAALISASPERLYRRKGAMLETEALAGSRPRGGTPEDDAELRVELLRSDKERIEHDLVKNEITARLEALGASVRADQEPSVRQLPGIQHLQTGIRARLETSTGDHTLLSALHPTPAVGGLPRDTARQHLRQTEPFDRGWFASPVGWVSADSSEFAVAIRSALILGDNVHVFAGAGIVAGSDPRDEWQELETKASLMLQALRQKP